MLDKAKFAAAFAADVRPSLAAFMADSQVPWGIPEAPGSHAIYVSDPAVIAKLIEDAAASVGKN